MASSLASWRRNEESPVVQLFVKRSSLENPTPEAAIEHHVSRLRRAVNAGEKLSHFMPYLIERKIKEMKSASELDCDGCLEPKGVDFSDGFRLILKKGAPSTRLRFTTAHEICHTFFYELVPEIKYAPHETDRLEERLCNIGAASLLIPAQGLIEEVTRMPVCLESLEKLSSLYEVSIETMLIRLRSLRLWSCELSLWHRMSNGDFVLDQFFGLTRAKWNWVDTSIPSQVWESARRGVVAGRTYVHFEDEHGRRWAKRVCYQARRRAGYTIALWDADPFGQDNKPLP